MNNIQIIREKIARRLEYCNISKMAEMLHINRATLIKLKNPTEGNPSSETLEKVANFLQIEAVQ